MEVITAILYTIVGYIIYKILDWQWRKPLVEKLHSKYILITGCDTGFGHEFSKRLDKLGCHVFAGCYSEKGEDELKKICSDRVVTFRLDVTDHESICKGYDFICEKLPKGKGLWGIVNNAGIGGNNVPVEWLSVSDYQQVLDVNTLGMVDVTTTFLPLVKKECGRIVNTTSLAGRVAAPGMAPYAVSKFAAEAFSDSLRRQMKIFKVSVHIIEPEFFTTNIVNTEATTKMYQAAFDRAPDDVKEEYGQQFVDKNRKVFQRVKSRLMNTNWKPVINAYEHAMLSVHPRTRYEVGFVLIRITLFLQALPTEIADFVLRLGERDAPKPQALRR